MAQILDKNMIIQKSLSDKKIGLSSKSLSSPKQSNRYKDNLPSIAQVVYVYQK